MVGFIDNGRLYNTSFPAVSNGAATGVSNTSVETASAGKGKNGADGVYFSTLAATMVTGIASYILN